MAIAGFNFGTWTQVATFTRANATFPTRPLKMVIDGQRIAFFIEHSAVGNQEIGVSLDGGTTWNFYDSGIAAGGNVSGLTYALGSLWLGELPTPALKRSDDFGQTWVNDSTLPQWAATSKWPVKATVSATERIYAFSGPGVASNTVRRRNSANSFTAVGTVGTAHYTMHNLPLEPDKVLLMEGTAGPFHKLVLESLTLEFTRTTAAGIPAGVGGVQPLFGATSTQRFFLCRSSSVIDRTLDNGTTWVGTSPIYSSAQATGFTRFGNYDFALTWNNTSFAICSIHDGTTAWANQLENVEGAGYNVGYAQVGNVTGTTADFYVITQNGTSFHVWKTTLTWTLSGPNFRLNYAYAEQAVIKFYDNLKAVIVCFPAGLNTTNSVTLWYFVGKGWVEDTRQWRMVIPFAVNDLATKIFAWDAAAGIIREIDVDQVYTDDGAAIVPRIDTGFIGGTDRDVVNRWCWLGFVTSETVSASVTATVGDDSATETFAMNTNVEERLEIIGRRLRLVIDFTSSAFFRLSELVIRYLPFRSFRPRS